MPPNIIYLFSLINTTYLCQEPTHTHTLASGNLIQHVVQPFPITVNASLLLSYDLQKNSCATFKDDTFLKKNHGACNVA